MMLADWLSLLGSKRTETCCTLRFQLSIFPKNFKKNSSTLNLMLNCCISTRFFINSRVFSKKSTFNSNQSSLQIRKISFNHPNKNPVQKRAVFENLRKDISRNTNAYSDTTNELTRTQLNARIAVWVVLTGGFCYWAIKYAKTRQIKGTPLFKGVMFTLRQDPVVRKWIGGETNNTRGQKRDLDEEISNDMSSIVKEGSFINGYLNHNKGSANLEFDIEGSGGKGSVKLEAVRYKDEWLVKKLIVSLADEEIVHIEPLANMRKYKDNF